MYHSFMDQPRPHDHMSLLKKTERHMAVGTRLIQGHYNITMLLRNRMISSACLFLLSCCFADTQTEKEEPRPHGHMSLLKKIRRLVFLRKTYGRGDEVGKREVSYEIYTNIYIT